MLHIIRDDNRQNPLSLQLSGVPITVVGSGIGAMKFCLEGLKVPFFEVNVFEQKPFLGGRTPLGISRENLQRIGNFSKESYLGPEQNRVPNKANQNRRVVTLDFTDEKYPKLVQCLNEDYVRRIIDMLEQGEPPIICSVAEEYYYNGKYRDGYASTLCNSAEEYFRTVEELYRREDYSGRFSIHTNHKLVEIKRAGEGLLGLSFQNSAGIIEVQSPVLVLGIPPSALTNIKVPDEIANHFQIISNCMPVKQYPFKVNIQIKNPSNSKKFNSLFDQSVVVVVTKDFVIELWIRESDLLSGIVVSQAPSHLDFNQFSQDTQKVFNLIRAFLERFEVEVSGLIAFSSFVEFGYAYHAYPGDDIYKEEVERRLRILKEMGIFFVGDAYDMQYFGSMLGAKSSALRVAEEISQLLVA